MTSLVEMVVSSVSVMTLLAGLTSAIFVASRAASPSNQATVTSAASLTLDEMAAELRNAKSFNGRTTTSVSFTVDDRSTDADSIDETILYAWTGAPGGDLIRTYNGTSTTVLSDVYGFSLAYTTSSQTTNRRVLFIQGEVSDSRVGYDQARVDLMAGWGYTVVRQTCISTTTQAELEAAAACCDVIYISPTLNSSDLGTKLRATAKTVLIEEYYVADSFGLATTDGDEITTSQISLVDNSHFITSSFSTGTLSILSSNSPLRRLLPTYAAGLKVYSTEVGGNGYANLSILETGGTMTGTLGRAAGRRVLLPWGGDNFDPSKLNSNGLTMWQRALQWATGEQLLTSVEATVRTTSTTGPLSQVRVAIIGKPSP